MVSSSQPESAPPRRATVGDPNAQGVAPTDIDRRSCSRVVPMKVLGLGVSRTGTASLRQALLDLGYNDTYHYGALLNENPRDVEMWNDALNAKFNGKGKPFGKEEWDQLLGHCQAVTDTPCQLFWRELLDAYPDAKVILTVRDSPEQWAASMNSTIFEEFWDQWYSSNTSWWHRILFHFIPVDATMGTFNKLLFRSPFYQEIAAGRGIEFYEAQNAAIRAAVPSDRLLEFNVKQGWAPLCTFLEKDIPSWDFPKTNQRNLFRQSFRGYNSYLESVAKKRAAWFGFAVTGLVGLGLGVLRFSG